MKFMRPKLSLALLLASLGVVGCNIFNPSGTDEVDDSDPDALISYAQKQYRKAQYAEAASLFAKAAALDSTKSEAHFGLAKAAMRAEGVNPFTLLDIVASSDSNEIPFMSITKPEKNTYYRGMAAVKKALAPLIHRDTLTALWEHAVRGDDDPTYEGTLNSDLRDQVREFRSTYRSGSSYTYPPTNESFPVSDRKYKYKRYQADYAAADFTNLVLGVLDLNHDGIIDDRDPEINFSLDSNGNVQVDVSAVLQAATTDSAFATSLNDNIDALADGTGDVASLIDNLGASIGLGNADSTDEATQEELTEQIDKLGDAVRFYKIGDKRDNDGDGCIDEELLDSVDNDDDGFIDEDLRLVMDPVQNPGKDNLDNDGDGLTDAGDSDEYWVGGIPATSPNGQRLLPFIDALPASISDSTGTMTRNSQNVEDKLAVVRDSSGTEYSLQERRTLIGGCWSYYNETRFQEYLSK